MNASTNDLIIAEVFVKEAMIDPFRQNGERQEAFHLAIYQNRLDILCLLLDAVNPIRDKALPMLAKHMCSSLFSVIARLPCYSTSTCSSTQPSSSPMASTKHKINISMSL